MKRKKRLIITGCILGGFIFLLIGGLLLKNDNNGVVNSSLTPVKEATNISSIVVDKQYDNLIFHEFEHNIEAVDALYRLEIQTNRSYNDNTFMENFAIMSDVIDAFFQEDFSKSFIRAEFDMDDGGLVYINYDDIEEKCVDEKYSNDDVAFLFGDNRANSGYMVQIDEALRNVWFSKCGLGDISSISSEQKDTYVYLSGKRQEEDTQLSLKDGVVSLSEMEQKVLSFANESFPLTVAQNIDFIISEVRVLKNENYGALSFLLRREYKGIPFEWGENHASGIYVDKFDTDGGELIYTDSTGPDTMLGFGAVNGIISESEKITEILTLEEAVDSLSDKIGENSVYDVYGVELVYRECYMANEPLKDMDSVLSPRWKIITRNQNDDKYTIFYVDVVTGEINERFSYYYE